jgi:hypothetical protein
MKAFLFVLVSNLVFEHADPKPEYFAKTSLVRESHLPLPVCSRGGESEADLGHVCRAALDARPGERRREDAAQGLAVRGGVGK